ncbi:hypothetical protein PENSUB_3067 [Penicillium subrubescens]|uniref:Uncharacterized protein n=1 Tax=Penicillium subrubescens TaxID=1316194 RepID=A0A1Q5UFX3_9EURO|nr:hypothetical protein PENSUB_3067 [Penicillium subrubescens]
MVSEVPCPRRHRESESIHEATKAKQNGIDRSDVECMSQIRDTIDKGPRGLWKVTKWARNRDQESASSNIPTLKGDRGPAETNQEKVDLLR